MIISVRRTAAVAAVAALSAALAACGGGTGTSDAGGQARMGASAAPSASPSTAGSAAPPAGSQSSPPAAEPQPGAPGRAPTMAPGPNGLTPVFERAKQQTDKTVALTFDADMTSDQGPRAAGGERFDNPQLISTLRTLKVPSTVFMTGRWAEEYPDQAKSIGTDPNFEIANHSYSHHAFKSPCYGLPTLDEAAARADVDRAFDAFRKAGAVNTVPYFRFPGGCYDDQALRAISTSKVTAVQWDVVSGDAFAKDPDAVAAQVLAGVKPGSVVVMHCTRSAAPVTEEAIRKIVPELRKRGYRFVKVSDLIGK
ncbi:polysaccharide deacetylase family protein [Streptomyces sp. TBY4]|uniref:polysaccharide deacetylase family protein n=1 Tax=Streptomyces sp. TBY4 TaxID=2962030 RepID=UPI0020B6AABB|nr:polysaccharide deacetylase family protein [Streptomyces sp. TBY4]MCP3757403.1 polysaccharide deacetylase family protein [Streptomyces sp. TBY4]